MNKTETELRLEAAEQVCRDMRAFIDEKGLTEEFFTWFNSLMQEEINGEAEASL